MKELTLAATIENIEAVTDYVNEMLMALGCPMKAQVQIDIAIDEIFSNIAQYAYTPDTGEATVRVEAANTPRSVVITFVDGGKPYDPLRKEDPDVSLPVDEREIGGLGIYMVKNSMDDVRYEYRDGQNRLSITKSWA